MPGASFPLLLLCFFLSGFAGLVYETAWTRELSFMFGTSSLAISTVLAAYMAGLAAGAALAARFAHRITRPVLAYGLLELGIAIAALGLPLAIRASRWLYVALFGGLGELPGSGGLSTGAFYAVCSFVILMVPTSMMGATLPLLTRHAVRSEDQIASRTGLLYATNTIGAVAGTLVAAYWLLPTFGLRHTIWCAAGVNAAVFAVAWALARVAPALPPTQPSAASSDADATARGAWILPLIFASGVASFAYEVMWVRLLEHVVGASVYAFASMLASFLAGIALGSAVASRFGTTPLRAGVAFALAQFGIAALSLAAFSFIGHVPDLASRLIRAGYSAGFANSAVSMSVLFPAALCIGATFPLAVRVLARDESDAAVSSARVYAANTLGSIIGSIATGFVLLPWLGFVGTLLVCLGLNFGIAAATAIALRPLRRGLLAAAVVSAALVFLFPPQTPWGVLLPTGTPRSQVPDLVHYGVGRSATVLALPTRARWRLLTNGLPEAVIDPPHAWHGRESPERWLGTLPVLARPDLESMLLVGLGGGGTLESVPPSVRRIEVVELEPEVLAANRALAPLRWRDPLAEARVHLRLNDARNALLLTEQRFDAIVSQPSHPWVGGAAHLYTREFFELASEHLSADGVFLQWVGAFFIDEELLRSMLATLNAVFVNVRTYSPPHGDAVIFLASNGALDVERSSARALAADPERFAEFGLLLPEDVTAALVLDERGTRAFSRGAPLNRDDHNRLQSDSPRVGERHLQGRVEESTAEHDPLVALPASEGDPLRLLTRVSPSRARRLSGLGGTYRRMQSLRDPADREAAMALVEARSPDSDPAEIRSRFARAISIRPDHPVARAGLLRVSREALAAGQDPETLLPAPLRPAERAVARAWGGARPAGDPFAQEEALAAVSVDDPLYRDATLLRVRLGLERGDATQAHDWIALTDRVRVWEFDDLLLRSEACVAAGESRAALDTLGLLALHFLRDSSQVEQEARRALELLRGLSLDPTLSSYRNEVERRLERALRR